MTVKVNLLGIGELDFPTGVSSASISAPAVTTVNIKNQLALDDDVSISSPTDGQVLTYVGSASKWENLTSGFNGVNAQTGTSYTFLQSDQLKLVTFNNAAAVAVTLPQAGTGGNFGSTWVTFVENLGAGTATITPTTSTIDGTTSLALTKNQGVMIFSDGTNYVTERGMASGGGGTTAGSINIAVAANPATVNVTTEGVKDWLCPAGQTTVPRQLGGGVLHCKALSSSLLSNSFDWVYGGNSQTIFTQTHTNPSITSTALDDLASGALSASVSDQGIFNSGSATGYGFRLCVPADTFTRTLRIYTSTFSAVATCTARLTDGSVADTSGNYDTGSGVTMEKYFTVTYNASRDGQFLEVTVLVSTNHGSSPNIKFIAATLA